jgi:positive regulator of sigma E activity
MKPQSNRYALVAEASATGLFFPVGIVAGYLLGKWTGGWLGWGEAPAYVGAAAGVVAAFWNLFEYLKRLERSTGNGN